ncbi:hypothetical protein FVE67_05010 [Thermosulfurimonas marina]|uniref:Ribosomal RNA small subunit methyltransferase G n=1 Tax=Thermosulfurimonas marina TaxID=2047767 RepID=A0A6H1WSP3_9BACT|nr:RsmG family class I SAM-dependent methyltransferase [Thermosulfurimonas marina]QJA06198.1 hypothetical protein FVE67_05010 [Thermosulfurimonas marina]
MEGSWSPERAFFLLGEMGQEYGLPFEARPLVYPLFRYLSALAARAEELNLTAFKSPEERLLYAVSEALVLAAFLPEGGYPLADLGPGGGIPGLVLKLARPELEIVLYEAHPGRVAFLEEMIAELGLSGIRAVNCHLGRTFPEERFPVVVARGYGSVEKFVRHARALLAPPGQAFYLWRQEVEPYGRPEGLEILGEIPFALPQGRGLRKLLLFGLSP